MGLSVLIPVYNFDVDLLVRSLSEQMLRSGRQGEIILLDDGSSESFQKLNQSVSGYAGVNFHYNYQNEGRMAARVRLSQLARFENLLFLDADSIITEPDFLNRYFDQLDAGYSLVSGGRIYSEKKPADCQYRLHWKYGSMRENRRKTHKPAFLSNNFLVKKSVFEKLDDSFSLTSYGHEDSWWGIQFEQSGLECRYIQNPVIHGSLATSTDFLEKSDQALANILLLENKVEPEILEKHLKIYRWYHRMKSYRLSSIFLFFEKPFHGYFRRNLLSCNPSLFYFDCHRLAELIRKGRLLS